MSQEYNLNRFILAQTAAPPNNTTVLVRESVFGRFSVDAYIHSIDFASAFINNVGFVLRSAIALSNAATLGFTAPQILAGHALPAATAATPEIIQTQNTFYVFPDLGLYVQPGAEISLYLAGGAAFSSLYTAVITWQTPQDALRRVRSAE